MWKPNHTQVRLCEFLFKSHLFTKDCYWITASKHVCFFSSFFCSTLSKNDEGQHDQSACESGPSVVLQSNSTPGKCYNLDSELRRQPLWVQRDLKKKIWMRFLRCSITSTKPRLLHYCDWHTCGLTQRPSTKRIIVINKLKAVRSKLVNISPLQFGQLQVHPGSKQTRITSVWCHVCSTNQEL